MNKLRLISLLAVLCMLLASCAGSEGSKADPEKSIDESAISHSGDVNAADVSLSCNASIAEMDGMYKTQGRTIVYDKGLALLSTADSFEFNATCEGEVYLKVFGESLGLTEEHRADPPDTETVELYFTLYIDGERSENRYKVNEGKNTLVLAEGLEKGEHNFRFVRQSEWEHGRAFIEGVSLDGEITERPADKELYIEFIGDSIATGFGNVPEYESDAQWGGAPIWQDGTQAFAYMTAEALDADYSVVAIEGIGASCGGWSFTMNDIYENYPRVTEKDYTYTPERTADIVVIELLSNDGSYWRDAGLTPNDIIEKGIELTEMAKEKHPDAKIIFSPGAFPKQFEEKYLEAFGGEENGYYIIDLPMNTEGKSGHPSVEGQQMSADALVPFIEEIVG